MARKLVAVRVEPTVLAEFRKLAKAEGSGLGYAVQRLMEAALTCQSINRLTALARVGNPRLTKADNHRFRVAMVELSGEFREQLAEWVQDKFVYVGGIERALRELQALIPLIDEPALLRSADRLISESLIFIKAIEILDPKLRREFLSEAERTIGPVRPKLRNLLVRGQEKTAPQ